ncbi:LCP family protein [Streptomyces sp.]|uniref:LCP family protein n=1 Tax=Streptomyces sp. TaxID=1931 RepID=UPI002D5203A2|nr:LCP family protein [Streptomyces sp.]HZF91136.1 LCP family protein [Streptomyces sp.]
MARSSVRGDVPAAEDTMSLTARTANPRTANPRTGDPQTADQKTGDAQAGDAQAGAPRSGGPERAEPAEGRGRHGGGGDGGGRGRGGRRGAARPRGRRVLRWSATVLSVVIVGTAGAGYLYYRHLNGNIQKDDLNLGDHKIAAPTPNAAGQTPLNILLIGSDARDSKENQKLGGAKETFGGTPLADVQMLLHLSADRKSMSVVSMPRDTLVHIPRCTDPDDGKVYAASTLPEPTNESLGHGGPGCTVATWQELTGIHIDHFMMIDFAGVVSMADAIGGVPVCVDANVYSRDRLGRGSGLKLEKGTTKIKGETALQWLRTRYGFGDNSDLYRAEAQHMYMNSMVRELRANATLSNPNKLRKLAEAATEAIVVDEGLGTLGKMYDLANELKKVPTDRITMTTMPNRLVGNRVEPTEDAETVFRMLREDIALDGKDRKKQPKKDSESDDPAAPDAEIAVQVRNATASDTQAAAGGRAWSVTQLLTGEGFTQAVADLSAPVAEQKTVIRFPSADLEGDAQRVAKALGIPLSQVKKSTDVSGVTLFVGADWREGTAYEVPKKEDRTPESANALNASDDSACMEVNPAYTWEKGEE